MRLALRTTKIYMRTLLLDMGLYNIGISFPSVKRTTSAVTKSFWFIFCLKRGELFQFLVGLQKIKWRTCAASYSQ
jgi:hypothetical protein